MEPADLIFFDPFSPVSNPALWTPATFAKLRAHARDDGGGCTFIRTARPRRRGVSLLPGGFFVGTGAAIGDEEGNHRGGDATELRESSRSTRAGFHAGSALRRKRCMGWS